MTSTMTLVTLLVAIACLAFASGSVMARQRRSIGSGSANITTYSNVSEEANIYCGGLNVKINISTAYLNRLNVANVYGLRAINESHDLSDDPACQVQRKPGDASVALYFNQYSGQCANRVEANADCIYVHYKLCVVPNNTLGISRDDNEFIYFTCKYNKNYTVSLTGSVQPLIQKEDVRFGVSGGSVAISMARFTDETFATVSTVGQIIVNRRVYMGLWLDHNQAFDIVLRGLSCWATPNQDPSMNQFEIITSGCPAEDQDLPGATQVITNFANDKFQFSLTSFYWQQLDIATQRIYIHCTVELCDNSVAANNCKAPITDPCPVFRKKRSAPTEYNNPTISIGPLNVEGLQAACNKEALGCEHDCVTMSSGSTACICPSGSKLASNGRTCEEELNLDVEKLVVVVPEKDAASTSSYATFFAVILLIVIVFVAFSRVLLKKQNVIVKI